MPLPLQKNPGPLLTSKRYGAIQNFPPEFIASVGVLTHVQQNPVDIEPFRVGTVSLLLESSVEQIRTDERKKTDIYLTEVPTGTLVSEVRLPSGLVATRTRSLVLEGTPLAPVDALTVEGDQKNLGNGWLDQTLVEAPSLFQQIRRSRERPVVTPEDFRALLQTTEAAANVTATFPASIPLLTVGQVSASAEQIDVFNYRATLREIDILSLPAFNVNKRTNRVKQVETVTRILELDSVAATPPTAVMDVAWTKLGDGTALEERVVVPEVFENKTSAVERTDLIPEFFKALIPVYVVEQTIEGIVVDPPVLSVGDLSKSETQIDVFNKRVVTRGRAGITYPQGPLVLLRHLGGMEFGGEVTRVVGLLDNTIPSVEEGLGIVSSEVRTIGNNTWFRQTEKWDTATEWPELVGTEVDPRTGIVVEVKRKVVAAGTTGGVSVDGYTDVKPIDKWRSLSIASKLDLLSLPTSRQWETTMEHSFPHTLNGAIFLWAAATGTLSYAFNSALILDITEGYAGPCRALVTESFSDGPPIDVIAITQFFPQGYTVGYAWSLAVSTTTECDSCTDQTEAHAQTWPIPPTLHDEIDIGGAVTLSGGSITGTLPATNPIALPASGTLITKAVEVEPWRFNIFYRRLVQIYVP